MDSGLTVKPANPLGIEPAQSLLQVTYSVAGSLWGWA
jgi:hypothetical protein